MLKPHIFQMARPQLSYPPSVIRALLAWHNRYRARLSGLVLPQPARPRYRLAHIGFASPGGPSRNKDKDRHGHRYDSVGICNGVIHAGASCVRFAYDPSDPERMRRELDAFDGYIVRINPGQLSNPGVAPGAQRRFDDAMRRFVDDGKPVWSSPAVQSAMAEAVGVTESHLGSFEQRELPRAQAMRDAGVTIARAASAVVGIMRGGGGGGGRGATEEGGGVGREENHPDLAGLADRWGSVAVAMQAEQQRLAAAAEDSEQHSLDMHALVMEVAPRAKLQDTFITAPNSDPDGDELVHQSLISNDTDAG